MIFKREKGVARRLEFSGLYITEQPPDDDVKGQWDRLVLNAQYGVPIGPGGGGVLGGPYRAGGRWGPGGSL